MTKTTHTRGCLDHAAYRAYNNDETIANYPSPEAAHVGVLYLNADIVDCRCDEHPECRHGWTGSEAIEGCAEGGHAWIDAEGRS